jgi:hypothetical protein
LLRFCEAVGREALGSEKAGNFDKTGNFEKKKIF